MGEKPKTPTAETLRPKTPSGGSSRPKTPNTPKSPRSHSVASRSSSIGSTSSRTSHKSGHSDLNTRLVGFDKKLAALGQGPYQPPEGQEEEAEEEEAEVVEEEKPAEEGFGELSNVSSKSNRKPRQLGDRMMSVTGEGKE